MMSFLPKSKILPITSFIKFVLKGQLNKSQISQFFSHYSLAFFHLFLTRAERKGEKCHGNYNFIMY